MSQLKAFSLDMDLVSMLSKLEKVSPLFIFSPKLKLVEIQMGPTLNDKTG